MILWSLSASAQDNQALGPLILSSSSTTSSPSTTTYSVGMYGAAERERQLKKNIKRLEGITRLQRHLEHNERQVQLALSLGGGDALKELVTVISPGAKLTKTGAKKMRRQHKTIRVIWRQKSTMARATALYDLLYPVLHPSTT